MILKQTQTLIFYYPDDFIAEYEWCKHKGDEWVHKGTDTRCSVYEHTTDFSIASHSEHRDCVNCEDASDCVKCRGFEAEPQTEEWYTYQDEQEYQDRWEAEPQTERSE